ncbi:MAG: hypothetical protein OWU32_13325 [Firmicutes bacterium]|nr:hypothetical protein [Bacillota bacterium]
MTSSPRQQVIIEAAYHRGADSRDSGFSTVADPVAINHATLLHYFPTIQHLVEAVVGYLLEQLQQESSEHQRSSPFAALCQEFDDFRKRRIHERAFFVVLSELQLRAYRDPGIAKALTPMCTQWRWDLVTGASRRVGYQTTLCMVAQGCTTALHEGSNRF